MLNSSGSPTIAAVLVSIGLSISSCTWNTGPQSALGRAATFAGRSREFIEPFGVAAVPGGIVVSDGDTGRILKVASDGVVSTLATGFETPSAIAVGRYGEIVVADSGSHTIRSVSKDGSIETIAGIDGQSGYADGPAAEALFHAPVGLAVDDAGRIFVSDTYNDRIRVVENGNVRTIAGGERGFSDGIGPDARFDTPLGLAVWSEGRLLVADAANRRIRVVGPDGRVWTLAGDGSGIFIDGPPAAAGFIRPTAIAVGRLGEIFIADGNSVRVLGRRLFPFVETLSSTIRGLCDGPSPAARFNRPSGLAAAPDGDLFVADSDNGLVRVFTDSGLPSDISLTQIESLRFSPSEFRTLQPGRWPYDPPVRPREIAGTFGEIRGEIEDENSEAWFHNGLDIPGNYGETARFIRSEKVLDPIAVENFDDPRELIRMPTLGYVHVRVGRDSGDRLYGDPRFQFVSSNGMLTGVRVPRGARFSAGDPIGTLNAMNHVHLVAGRPGAEMNPLDALVIPGISDTIAPVIEEVRLFDENWAPKETKTARGRIIIGGKMRVVVQAYDRKDGNSERRRLAPYRIGYDIVRDAEIGRANGPGPKFWSISFERIPANRFAKLVYASGSRSGATGETVFNFIATNRSDGGILRESFVDTASYPPGECILRVFVSDYFGNVTTEDVQIEVIQ